jgi:hypothetical protein
MGLRETMNKYPLAGYAIIPIAAAAVILGIRAAKNVEPSAFGSSFFSVDDGKSYFPDDAKKIPPFDHHGSQAMRAHVFTGSDGKLFVGYLERVNPGAADVIKKVQDRKPTDPPLPMSDMATVLAGHEYKRPGDKEWVKGSDMIKSKEVRTILGSDGSPLIEVDE